MSAPSILVAEVDEFLQELRNDFPDVFKTAAAPKKNSRNGCVQELRKTLDEKLPRFAGMMAVRYGRVFIKNQRTRWGSCSVQGNLNFNWRLALAPLEVVDYVVVHELAHLLEMNHSKRFWGHVAAWCPDHKAHRRWLRENGARLGR